MAVSTRGLTFFDVLAENPDSSLCSENQPPVPGSEQPTDIFGNSFTQEGYEDSLARVAFCIDAYSSDLSTARESFNEVRRALRLE